MAKNGTTAAEQEDGLKNGVVHSAWGKPGSVALDRGDSEQKNTNGAWKTVDPVVMLSDDEKWPELGVACDQSMKTAVSPGSASVHSRAASLFDGDKETTPSEFSDSSSVTHRRGSKAQWKKLDVEISYSDSNERKHGSSGQRSLPASNQGTDGEAASRSADEFGGPKRRFQKRNFKGRNRDHFRDNRKEPEKDVAAAKEPNGEEKPAERSKKAPGPKGGKEESNGPSAPGPPPLLPRYEPWVHDNNNGANHRPHRPYYDSRYLNDYNRRPPRNQFNNQQQMNGFNGLAAAVPSARRDAALPGRARARARRLLAVGTAARLHRRRLPEPEQHLRARLRRPQLRAVRQRLRAAELLRVPAARDAPVAQAQRTAVGGGGGRLVLPGERTLQPEVRHRRLRRKRPLLLRSPALPSSRRKTPRTWRRPSSRPARRSSRRTWTRRRRRTSPRTSPRRTAPRRVRSDRFVFDRFISFAFSPSSLKKCGFKKPGRTEHSRPSLSSILLFNEYQSQKPVTPAPLLV
ncbi:hypothetical protein M3Y99_00309000 [Aphelenchoides fujianensis]|nr:hypothetical protein M3Y99_00309000 [Aphelenchoides fujianensis]